MKERVVKNLMLVAMIMMLVLKMDVLLVQDAGILSSPAMIKIFVLSILVIKLLDVFLLVSLVPT
jgi:hypothetical protein